MPTKPTRKPKDEKKPTGPPMPREYTRETFFVRDIPLATSGDAQFTLHVEIMSIGNKPPVLSLRIFKQSPKYDGPTRDGLILTNFNAVHELMDVLPGAMLAWAKAKG